ncbi:MAG: hypothetical protein H6R45_550 [Proteobacteria bacterium]|nr:hypothetical protein [Pseudomonadota bacterium]
MKRRFTEFVRRLGFGEEDFPSLGIAMLCAAAILATAAAGTVPGYAFPPTLLLAGA